MTRAANVVGFPGKQRACASCGIRLDAQSAGAHCTTCISWGALYSATKQATVLIDKAEGRT